MGLRAWGLRQGGVGILVGLLLLPVGVIAQEAGDLYPTFGVGGESDHRLLWGRGGTPPAVALQPDGKIVAVGLANDPSTGSRRALPWRATSPNGTLDTTFGGDGRVIIGLRGAIPPWPTPLRYNRMVKLFLGPWLRLLPF